jgi:hypothetical protein
MMVLASWLSAATTVCSSSAPSQSFPGSSNRQKGSHHVIKEKIFLLTLVQAATFSIAAGCNRDQLFL